MRSQLEESVGIADDLSTPRSSAVVITFFTPTGPANPLKTEGKGKRCGGRKGGGREEGGRNDREERERGKEREKGEKDL